MVEEYDLGSFHKLSTVVPEVEDMYVLPMLKSALQQCPHVLFGLPFVVKMVSSESSNTMTKNTSVLVLRSPDRFSVSTRGCFSMWLLVMTRSGSHLLHCLLYFCPQKQIFNYMDMCYQTEICRFCHPSKVCHSLNTFATDLFH